jgi:hypothetical protein
MAQAAMNDVWAGNRIEGRQKAKRALKLSSGREGEAIAAVALAVAGDTAEALRLADDLANRFPQNTSQTYLKFQISRLGRFSW